MRYARKDIIGDIASALIVMRKTSSFETFAKNREIVFSKIEESKSMGGMFCYMRAYRIKRCVLSQEDELFSLLIERSEKRFGKRKTLDLLERYKDILPLKIKKKYGFAKDGKRYLYCYVRFSDGGKSYCYIYDDKNIKVGMRVLAPVGEHDEMHEGVVVKTAKFSYDNAPFPVALTKHIISISD